MQIRFNSVILQLEKAHCSILSCHGHVKYLIVGLSLSSHVKDFAAWF